MSTIFFNTSNDVFLEVQMSRVFINGYPGDQERKMRMLDFRIRNLNIVWP